VTFRKLASAQIACECTQLSLRLRFEYVDAHADPFLGLRTRSS
jgi:hypothetical protein